MSPQPDARYFSGRFQQFLEKITPYGRPPSLVFPRACHPERIGRESIGEWFINLVNGHLEMPESCTVEENMAVFADIHFDRNTITHACIQIVIAETDLAAFYLDPEIPCTYLRLDYDQRALGPMFTHPLPHIHCMPDGAPRFSLPLRGEGNIIIEHFDFVYRNFYPEIWKEWARNALKARESLATDEVLESFDVIWQAFQANQASYLIAQGYGDRLSLIKTACHTQKSSIFNYRIDTSQALQLNYEEAQPIS